jgi:His-Xaa-Ser system protein HxsD
MKLPGIPEDLATADVDEGSVHVRLDESVHPLEAVYAATYTFIDRAWVFVDRPEAGKLRVVLAPKKGPADEKALAQLIGELANELLSAAYRHLLTRESRATLEAVTMQAIAGAMGPPSLDELEDFDFSEEAFEDPLGIAQSWEEKYQKKAGAAKDDASAPASAAEKKDE